MTAGFHELEGHLDAAVAELFDAAGQATPMGGAAWDALLRRWRLDPPGSPVRTARQQATGQQHFAAAIEVRALLDVVATSGQRALDHLVAQHPDAVADHGPAWSQVAALRNRLHNLADHQASAYRQQVLPEQPKARLGGIFANASRKVRDDPWDGWDAVLVVHCIACGAPQESVRVFTCARCDQPVFGELGHP